MSEATPIRCRNILCPVDFSEASRVMHVVQLPVGEGARPGARPRPVVLLDD